MSWGELAFILYFPFLKKEYLHLFRFLDYYYFGGAGGLFFFRAALRAHGSSRLGVEMQLQLPAYTTETQDPSRLCDQPHSS